MARKKIRSKRKQKQSKTSDKTNSKNQNDSETPDAIQSRAQKFLENLGPEGYLRASATLSKDININKYSMTTPDGATPLLQNTSLKITFGRKYGLIGRNGYGKTTLLNNMANYTIEGYPPHIRMMLVHQECKPDDPRKVMDAVLEADVIRNQILKESERLEELLYEQDNDDDIQRIQTDLDDITQHMEELQLKNSHARAFRILTGLGFSRDMRKETVKSLSGGWRMRLEIAKALFVAPDLLLLDEPTNHLDFPAVLWLQEYLAAEFDKTLVVVSHDKMFLDSVVTHVIHLDHEEKCLTYYKGNYVAFEAARNEKLQAIANNYRAHQFQITSLEEFIEKFRDKGEKRAAQIQSKMKTLQKLKDSSPPKPIETKPFVFKFPQPVRLEQHLVIFDDVDFCYVENRPVLDKINLAVDMDSRVGLIGANGVGKSTLVKLILNKLKPTLGDIEREPRASFAFFSQHHFDTLDFTVSAVEYFLTRFAEHLSKIPDRVQHVRRYLGRFGIKNDRQNQKMELLSGGQKSRVAFAEMAFLTPHFIIMDEPTNHLDVEAVDALIDALSQFNGGVLLVSHDTHFISRAAKEFWTMTKEGIIKFEEFEDAKNFALEKRINETRDVTD